MKNVKRYLRKKGKKTKKIEESRLRREAAEKGMGCVPGMTPQMMQQIANDPEIQEILRDPQASQILQEITQNPEAFLKYQSNPKVIRLMQKMSGIFGQNIFK